jgi:hypothetical protein
MLPAGGEAGITFNVPDVYMAQDLMILILMREIHYLGH